MAMSAESAIETLKKEAGGTEVLDEKGKKIIDNDGKAITYGKLITNTGFLKIIVKAILEEVKKGEFKFTNLTVKDIFGSKVVVKTEKSPTDAPIKVDSIS